eukprot:GHVH01010121.1.p1 GENE.GHVH01010121.1~~GHVH01010121.1.p1  ORF type:complete len:519 (+),score=72.24 GHVH01010121.1:108-1664(+)
MMGNLRVKEDIALTFDDVLLIPQHSKVNPAEANLTTRLTGNINLNIPLVSAAMDTVTEHKLAIVLAESGGIGIIHKNMSIADQAIQVRSVKRYQGGVVRDPVTVTPGTMVKDVKKLSLSYGFSCFPVVDDSKKLLGICTARDIRFVTDENSFVGDIMTTKESVVSFTENSPNRFSHCNSFKDSGDVVDPGNEIVVLRPEIQRLMHEKKVEKVLLINPRGNLTGLVTARDFDKMKMYPNACVDDRGRLRCGAAVGCGSECLTRVRSLVEEGVDVVVVDSSHGHSQAVLDTVINVRAEFPTLEIIGGNVATAEGCLALIQAGCNAVKVGIGPGSICTTRVVTGVGVPQLTAVANAVRAAEPYGIPIIADGGIRQSGDICKAIAAGSSCAMMGSAFAGVEEAPGEMVFLDGRTYKSYRGMGSLGAMECGSADRYFQDKKAKLVPEGIEGRVAYKGNASDVIKQMIGGIRSCMGLTGCQSIGELQSNTWFYRITGAGITESYVHDVAIAKEAPNYPSNRQRI